MMPRYPMWPMVAVIMAGIVLSCQQARAETSIGIHIGSQHDKAGFNNFNPGVYVNHNGYTLGTYYNSERKQSYYAGYTAQGELVRGLNWGLTIGAITGYAALKVAPLVVPSVSYHNNLLGGRTRLSLAVKTNRDGANALHLSQEWAL